MKSNMKHFIAFQKRKGLFIPTVATEKNEDLVHQFNHELMKYGYILGKDLFERLSGQTVETIQEVYNDLLKGIRKVTGGGGYEPIYRNFPQSVLEMSYREFLVNAIMHYWSFGTWRPEDAEYVNREFKLEPVKYKSIRTLTQSEFESIFTDILYSGSSISKFDKEIVDFFIEEGYAFDFGKITFKETAAYVGKRLMDSKGVEILPTKDASNILRVWAAYSGGDEGLKENTKFKNPNASQRRIMLKTLQNCHNLEESFKTYREIWLRVLFYLNPLTAKNKEAYPAVYQYAALLRNTPKELRTFNSRVEELFGKKDAAVLDLLKKRPGVFKRRIDHAVREFGIVAITKWLETNPKLLDLVTAYNVFTDRDKEQAGRGAILAGQGASNVVTYDALKPLDAKLVAQIKGELLSRIQSSAHADFLGKKVYIDRSLYYRPLAMNNRAASLSLDGKANGTVEVAPAGKVIRMYVHWHGRSDIDLSALMLTADNGFSKVGWNADHRSGAAVIYSGDNTGIAEKNAEYMDIVVDKLPTNTEWIITEARIFRGPSNYKGYAGKARAGWMVRQHPEANRHWLPETLEHSVVLESTSSTAYLMALHVPTRSLVYLDLAMGNQMVSSADDAIKMRMFLESFVTLDDGSEGVNWERLNQGHIVNVISENIVENKEDADIVFDENTTWEGIAKYL